MTPVILSRQQLDQLWEIDRSELSIRSTVSITVSWRAYREYYDVRGWDPHDRQVYTPIHEACYDRGRYFFSPFLTMSR
ncbi:acetyltransferase [Klebsiella pneumoniae]|uniref:Acetyltransferase n=1 Tax=Klebsiella pneumoniae TaxID=573 RepID=A0A4P0YGG7_KLEPN|nr:acetyltransferase [Klebsiella pneumoniae]